MNIEVPKLRENVPEHESIELKVATAATLRAGQIIRRGYTQAQSIQEKGLGDLVSQIDVDCDKVIQEEIHKIFPNDKILSEELSPDISTSEGRFWVVDPLDATSAFLFKTGEDMPAVMIGLHRNGKTVMSVVHFPLTNEVFFAVRGQGAYKGDARLRVSDSTLQESWIEMNQYSNTEFESDVFRRLRENLRKQPGGARLVSSSPPHSGVGIRIAEGKKKLSAVVHDNGQEKIKQAPWDVIPVALILEESGGVIVNFKGELYDPFKPEPFIMASSKQLANEIIARSK